MASRRNQPEKRPDRRKQRTRTLLRDSLMSLIIQKGYDAITVQNITDEANLSRAAFYLHYKDKEELFVTSLEEIFDDLVKNLGPTSGNFLLPGGSPSSLMAFRHADKHRDLYKVILRGQGISGITRRIRDYLVAVMEQRIKQMLPGAKPPIPVEIVANHITGSLLALITWWIESDAPYTAEDMSQIFYKLNVQALMAEFKDQN